MAGIFEAAKKAITGYGRGNWGLPEFGITESLGGKKNSLVKATQTSQPKTNSSTNSSSSLNYTPTRYTPAPTFTSVPKGDVLGESIEAGNSQSGSTRTGNSSGGSKSVSAINPVTGEEQLYQDESEAINSLYKDSENYLKNLEKSAIAGEQDFYKQYTAPYETQIPQLEGTLPTERAEADMGINSARNEEQSALAQARRLYNELNQRNMQQFGGVGGSSAGQAAGEISARELQRNVGNIQRQVADQVQKINQQYNEYENNINTKVRELNLQKEVALSQARELFRQRLDEINRSKLELGQNKANARLNLLQQFRQRIQTINDQVRSQEMQFEAMREQARISLGNQIAVMNKQAELNNYTPDTSGLVSNATNISTVSEPQSPLSFGYYAPTKRNEDRFGINNFGFLG